MYGKGYQGCMEWNVKGVWKEMSRVYGKGYQECMEKVCQGCIERDVKGV